MPMLWPLCLLLVVSQSKITESRIDKSLETANDADGGRLTTSLLDKLYWMLKHPVGLSNLRKLLKESVIYYPLRVTHKDHSETFSFIGYDGGGKSERPHQGREPEMSNQVGVPGLPNQGGVPDLLIQGRVPRLIKQSGEPALSKTGRVPGSPKQGGVPRLTKQGGVPGLMKDRVLGSMKLDRVPGLPKKGGVLSLPNLGGLPQTPKQKNEQILIPDEYDYVFIDGTNGLDLYRSFIQPIGAEKLTVKETTEGKRVRNRRQASDGQGGALQKPGKKPVPDQYDYVFVEGHDGLHMYQRPQQSKTQLKKKSKSASALRLAKSSKVMYDDMQGHKKQKNAKKMRTNKPALKLLIKSSKIQKHEDTKGPKNQKNAKKMRTNRPALKLAKSSKIQKHEDTKGPKNQKNAKKMGTNKPALNQLFKSSKVEYNDKEEPKNQKQG